MTRRSTFLLIATLAFISLPPTINAQIGSNFGKNKVQYKNFQWKYIQSPHFDVYFYQGGGQLAEFTADHAEEALKNIESTVKYDITSRIAILIYNSHNDFQQTNAVGEYLPEGVGGVTELLKNRVVLPFEGDYELFRHVIHHELTHAVINDMFVGGNYQALLTGGGMEIPSWMNEGLAEYTSLHGLDLETDMFMRDATLNEAVPKLDRLGGYVQYRVGQTMYWYISQKYGPDKVGELLQRIKTSRNVEQGFKSTFGLSVVEFGDKFIEALKVLYFPDIARYEDPSNYAEVLADHKKLDNYMNVSPEISPQGDLVAFISDRNDYYDVYVQSLNKPGNIRKILNGGGANPNFEELHLLTPGMSWSPDGKRIALASKAGETDAIFLINVDGSGQERLPNINLDGIQQLKWSPDGKTIAFIGVEAGQSDLYFYDIPGRALRNITNDAFSDHDPTWAQDSKTVYFTSEREDYTTAGQYPISNPNGVNYESTNRDIYAYSDSNHAITRITKTETANEYYPAVAQGHLFYISNQNGINNIWSANLDGSSARPLTNSLAKIDQISVSNDGTKLVFSTMHKGGYDLYMLRNPNERHIDSLQTTEYVRSDAGRVATRMDSISPTKLGADTAKGYGNVSVDLHDYVYGSNPAIDRNARPPRGKQRAPAEVVTNYKDTTGHYVVHDYRTVFSPDIIMGSAGYTGYYGLQGTTQMLFSDELGNQQIFFATNLILDLKNSDYILAYYNLENRLNWGLQGYHSARFIYEVSDPAVPNLQYPLARFNTTGLIGTASYPIDRFTRIDLNTTAAIFQKDLIVTQNIPTKTRLAIFPQLSYVHDDALWSYFYPNAGTRYNIAFAAAPKLASNWLGFFTPSLDFRHYFKLTSGISLASRISGAASFGPTPQKFFIGGVDSWINRTFKDIASPLTEPEDFAFFTPGYPLRGFSYDEKIGTHYGIANLELRYPFPITVAGFPIAFFGDSFIDAGTAWTNKVYLFQRSDAGSWITRDLLLSTGTGIRTYLFGFYVHMDIAWTTNLQAWSHPNYIVSIGEDF